MKKNKSLKIFATLIPLFLIGIMVYLFFSFQKKKEKIEALKNVPSFSLTTIGGTLFTSTNLDNNKIKILVYFSPSCHFCQAEAEELSKSYEDYHNIQWIWVASEPLNEIKEFAEQHKLNNQNNIIWCHDEMATLYRKLAMNSIPYFLVYDKNNYLIKRNSGAIKLEKLINTSDENK
ncbi:redoxin domain-containing protein [Chryseobacterium rhizoplanae]|uniref:TlpA family protein disulfide reductase n=1 Tax=Chryseobacterium rhizoplanae TaxID=1609531 RepID=UPI001CE2E908|nr:redoxin domain-containing protein [Chryseobacterium rhizoplanae]UCA58275.1 redoxin domain-containing protein [Chryseobacterium rhizoplanae]